MSSEYVNRLETLHDLQTEDWEINCRYFWPNLCEKVIAYWLQRIHSCELFHWGHLNDVTLNPTKMIFNVSQYLCFISQAICGPLNRFGCLFFFCYPFCVVTLGRFWTKNFPKSCYLLYAEWIDSNVSVMALPVQHFLILFMR